MKIKYLVPAAVVLVLLIGGFRLGRKINFNRDLKPGQAVDELNGVKVYFNGGVGHIKGRNTAANGYNLGVQWQCVEFVKRFYYLHFQHQMPDSYGNAKDFFDTSVADGSMNSKRALLQYTNPSQSRPQPLDIIIFRPTLTNRFGHIAIISEVTDHEVEVIQQNPGPFGESRIKIRLEKLDGGTWEIKDSKVLGRLGLPAS